MKNRQNFSKPTFVISGIHGLLLLLVNLSIYFKTLDCTGYDCMLQMAYYISLPALGAFVLLFAFGQRNRLLFFAFLSLNVGLLIFSIFLFVDPAELRDFRLYFGLSVIVSLANVLSLIRDAILRSTKKTLS